MKQIRPKEGDVIRLGRESSCFIGHVGRNKGGGVFEVFDEGGESFLVRRCEAEDCEAWRGWQIAKIEED